MRLYVNVRLCVHMQKYLASKTFNTCYRKVVTEGQIGENLGEAGFDSNQMNRPGSEAGG